MEAIIRAHGSKEKALILVVGTYTKALEFCAQFPHATIYLIRSPSDTMEPSCPSSRIFIFSSTIDDHIDICYIQGQEYITVVNSLPINRIILLATDDGVIYHNRSNLEMYCIYHTKYYLRPDNFYFTMFGVYELYLKDKMIGD